MIWWSTAQERCRNMYFCIPWIGELCTVCFQSQNGFQIHHPLFTPTKLCTVSTIDFGRVVTTLLVFFKHEAIWTEQLFFFTYYRAHDMFSRSSRLRIYELFRQYSQLKKKQNFLLVKKCNFFSQFWVFEKTKTNIT